MKFFAQGRTAFYHGLIKLDIKKKNKIYIPNYICRSLLSPIIKLNINYSFYNIKRDFTFNINDIKKNIQAEDCLLIVHYFGQPNNIDVIKNFCKKNKIKLIEDNSHGYSGKLGNKLLGTFGEIGFSSPRKILNIETGGVLFYKGKMISSNLKNYNLSKFLFVKNYLNKFFLFKYLKDRFYHQSNIYFNKIKKLEDSLLNYSADSVSNKIIKKTNWRSISNIRRIRWIEIVKILKKKNCTSAFKRPLPRTCPWVAPFYARNKVHRDEIIIWGINLGIKVITWPNLPKFLSKKDSKNCKLRWEKLFCVELDNSIDRLF